MRRNKVTSSPGRSTRTIPVALSMIFIATALTTAAMSARVFLGAPPDGTRATLYSTAASQALMATAVALVIAFAVWLAAHIWILRRRASLPKSLLALLCTVLIAVTAGVLTRLHAVAVYQNAYRAAVGAWQEDTEAQIKKINNQIQSRLDALYAQQRPWAEINAKNVAQEVYTRRQALDVLDRHQRRLAGEATSAIGRLPYGHRQWRMRTAESFESHMQLPLRAFALERQFVEAEVQILTFLSEHEAHWTNANGSFSFAESSVGRQFQALIVRRDELEEQAFQAVRAWADAEGPPTPTDSAPQPPQ